MSRFATRPMGQVLTRSNARDCGASLNIVLAEPMGQTALARIQRLSAQEAKVTSLPVIKGSPDELTEAVVNAMKGQCTDLLVVRGNCKVNQDLIERLSAEDRPKFVLRAGTGMDNLNMDYLDSQGIGYTNTPDVNTQSTAEHALALMLAVKRKIPQADARVKSGEWNRSVLTGSELGGKTLGIIGVGRIGGVVGTAAKALGMTVIGLASARRKAAPGELPAYLSGYVSLDELCERSDVLTLHVPLDNTTRGMIGERQIEQLSGRNAVIVNAARGGVVAEAPLLAALESGAIGGAGIDVFVQDPAPAGSVSDRLARHPNVVATPHVGGQTVEASEKMGDAVVEQARRMLQDRPQARGQFDA
ncbi:MAG TPA: NAD(P)-dependent oxidoreductase [Limnobacter sp.]